ncbi:hypothetical protein GGS23DRAFT_549313 [Durotheca rogersii]|uniref:uncharacterized protein n=1 Tax=Durotheca rogersii TaxID=419775 RepID=UPI00221EAC55|nr:uncharacterized protein GGS23DRAFT_549313 [Durotheca rogersii]KAI5867656.1 hypothetical protein GGS23DRAFT_549313 [Durotheca rogersii]
MCVCVCFLLGTSGVSSHLVDVSSWLRFSSYPPANMLLLSSSFYLGPGLPFNTFSAHHLSICLCLIIRSIQHSTLCYQPHRHLLSVLLIFSALFFLPLLRLFSALLFSPLHSPEALRSWDSTMLGLRTGWAGRMGGGVTSWWDWICWR